MSLMGTLRIAALDISLILKLIRGKCRIATLSPP